MMTKLIKSGWNHTHTQFFWRIFIAFIQCIFQKKNVYVHIHVHSFWFDHFVYLFLRGHFKVLSYKVYLCGEKFWINASRFQTQKRNIDRNNLDAVFPHRGTAPSPYVPGSPWGRWRWTSWSDAGPWRAWCPAPRCAGSGARSPCRACGPPRPEPGSFRGKGREGK